MTSFRWFQVVSSGFRWFQVVPRFSKYAHKKRKSVKKKNNVKNKICLQNLKNRTFSLDLWY